MNDFLTSLWGLKNKLVHNIAFIPSLSVILFFSLAIIMMAFENEAKNAISDQYISIVLVKGAENARIVLSIIIGGMISLTVFSFSMVMVVLNRASASLSPRVLPQLIGKTSHQLILGFYVGTILYSLLLIINIRDDQIPSFGIFFSMIFTVTSLSLFIYFIHSISRSIQVDQIMYDVFCQTQKQMTNALRISNKETGSEGKLSSKVNKIDIKAPENGYFEWAGRKGLIHFLLKNKLIFFSDLRPEQFYAKGTKIGEIWMDENHELDKELLWSKLTFRKNIENDNYYTFGLLKISEIAIKSLSPAINDPGTAERAIRLLTSLLEQFVQIENSGSHHSRYGLIDKKPLLDQILEDNIQPIIQYAEGNLKIYLALAECYQLLYNSASSIEQKTLVTRTLDLFQAASSHLTLESDRRTFESVTENLQKLTGNQFGIN